MKNENLFSLLCIVSFIVGFFTKKENKTITIRNDNDDREAQARIRGLHSESKPRKSNPYRKHSARTDRAYFIGSPEMFEYVESLIREKGLEYKFSYYRDLRTQKC
jgi:hypothetical protein